MTALAVPNRNLLNLIIMALQLLCYLSMRRFNDFQNIKVGDIRVLANGDLRLFQKIGKTFQMGQGTFIHVMNKPFGGFTVENLMDQYVFKLGLKSDDYLFPHFAKSSSGVMTVCKVPIGYGNARDELHQVLFELSLPQVSLHSARASTATLGAEAGMEVSTLRDRGGWKGSSMLTYFRSERPLQ